MDSLLPGVGNWVEPFIDIDNAGRGAGFGVIRNRLVLFDVSEWQSISFILMFCYKDEML